LEFGLTAARVKELAHDCGFELAGVAAASPADDYGRFDAWRTEGNAGEMKYLTDHRGNLRSDPRQLLPSAQTILCVGKLYNTAGPERAGDGTISRYAWGLDYHVLMRAQLETLVDKIGALSTEPFESRICVDTAPLLERSYARTAGLGWIGKNTCLINQDKGSWFFLGEVLLSIPLTPDAPGPFRCGTCTRCIDACPTEAIVPDAANGWKLDARLCISYLTIEKRGQIEADLEEKVGDFVFGCDICQDVCPWNGRAPVTTEISFKPAKASWSLSDFAALTPQEFRTAFRRSPVWRAKYSGFLRNVAIAMGNARRAEHRHALEMLCSHEDGDVSETAKRALERWIQSDAS
jgi:epoxyqueuosine reductase